MNNSSQKSLILFATLLITPVIAGVYGVLHDQLTYTICPEYYTRFKFIQFNLYGLNNQLPLPARVAVTIVGWKATWWTGLFIGPGIAFTGLIHASAKTMFNANIKALLITMAVALITGLVGLGYGYLISSAPHPVRWLPEGLIDRTGFITVGSMHNFSYLGGLLGMIGGVIYHAVKKRKEIS